MTEENFALQHSISLDTNMRKNAYQESAHTQFSARKGLAGGGSWGPAVLSPCPLGKGAPGQVRQDPALPCGVADPGAPPTPPPALGTACRAPPLPGPTFGGSRRPFQGGR